VTAWRIATGLGLAAILLAGCANPRLVKPEGEAEVDAYKVDPQIEWSRERLGSKLQIWTVDGVPLEQLRLYSDIEDGDTLFPEPRRPVLRRELEHRPKFKGDMRAHDVMDLVAATLAQSGAMDVKANNLRPADFGGRAGFRFDVALQSQTGLAYEGLAAGAVTDERLQLILFMAAKRHYFDTYAPVVRRIFESVEFL